MICSGIHLPRWAVTAPTEKHGRPDHYPRLPGPRRPRRAGEANVWLILRALGSILLAIVFGIGSGGCGDDGNRPTPASPEWILMGNGLSEPVTALLVHDAELIAATVDRDSGQPEAALWRWNGVSWNLMTSRIAGVIVTIEDYQGSLVIGGYIEFGTDNAFRGIARWDGPTWQPIGEPLENHSFSPTVYVNAMAHWNGSLAFAGRFGGSTNVATWDGQHIRFLPCPLNPQALTVWQGDLLVGGEPDSDVQCTEGSRILAWQGDHWTDFAGGIQLLPEGCPPEVTVNAAIAATGAVIVSGSLPRVGGVPVGNVARWTGAAWEPMGVLGAETEKLMEANGHLLAADPGTESTTLKCWDGEKWTAVGSSFDGSIASLAIFDGDVIAAGDFSGAVARFPLEDLDE